MLRCEWWKWAIRKRGHAQMLKTRCKNRTKDDDRESRRAAESKDT